MTKLIAAPPRLAAPAARLASTATPGSGFATTDGRSAAARGYDGAWRALRREVLDATPICVLCRSRRATEVDHIVAFRGLHDPLRLARSNSRSVCKPCSQHLRQAPPARRARPPCPGRGRRTLDARDCSRVVRRLGRHRPPHPRGVRSRPKEELQDHRRRRHHGDRAPGEPPSAGRVSHCRADAGSRGAGLPPGGRHDRGRPGARRAVSCAGASEENHLSRHAGVPEGEVLRPEDRHRHQARARRATHIILGRGEPPWWRRALGQTLIAALTRQAPEFTVQVVPSQAAARVAPMPRHLPGWAAWLVVPLLVGAATLVCSALDGMVPDAAFGMVYLAAIVAIAAIVGPLHAGVGAVLAFLVWDFLFLPPRYTLTIASAQDVLGAVVFGAVAALLAGTTGRLGRNVRSAALRLAALRRLQTMMDTRLREHLAGRHDVRVSVG